MLMETDAKVCSSCLADAVVACVVCILLWYFECLVEDKPISLW